LITLFKKRISKLQECKDNIHSNIEKTNQAIMDSEKVQTLSEEWWVQPAQYITPWVKLKGMNVQQWIQQYQSLITKLEQI